jgi:hypothetical protein
MKAELVVYYHWLTYSNNKYSYIYYLSAPKKKFPKDNAHAISSDKNLRCWNSLNYIESTVIN